MTEHDHLRQSGPDTGSYRVPARTWIVWLMVLFGILFLVFFKSKLERGDLLTQYEFEKLVESNRIVRAVVNYDPQNSAVNEIKGTYIKAVDGSNYHAPFQTRVRLTRGLEEKLFSLPQFEPRQPNTALLSVVWSIVPVLIVAAVIWFFFIRQIKKAARKVPNTATLFARTEELQARFDQVLNRWEKQASRIEALLDKLEREKGRRD
jgi:ATP-dependent Zn protease